MNGLRWNFLVLHILRMVFTCFAESTEVTVTATLEPSEFAIVVDMGSSGSRVFVYERIGDRIEGSKGLKVSPGISTFVHDPKQAAPYLRPLLEYAAKLVPAYRQQETPLYLKATAGMRLQSNETQRQFFEALRSDLANNCPFRILPEVISTFGGQT